MIFLQPGNRSQKTSSNFCTKYIFILQLRPYRGDCHSFQQFLMNLHNLFETPNNLSETSDFPTLLPPQTLWRHLWLSHIRSSCFKYKKISTLFKLAEAKYFLINIHDQDNQHCRHSPCADVSVFCYCLSLLTR